MSTRNTKMILVLMLLLGRFVLRHIFVFFRNGKESEKSDNTLTKKLEIKRLPSDVLFVSFTESNFDATRKKLGKFKTIF